MLAPETRSHGEPLVTGLEDLAATFAEHGLGDPPVPAGLAGQVVRLDTWLWSTREIDRSDLYDPPDLIDEAARPCADYIAIGESGHGANSWFLTCRAVVGSVALFVQDGWAGISMDEPQRAASLRALFAQVKHLLAQADGIPADGRRLLIVVSPAKSWDLCQWVEMDGRTRSEIEPPGPEWPMSALEAAVDELRTAGHPPTSYRVAVTVRLDWQPVGAFESMERGPWIRDLQACPAIYRIRFVGMAARWVYIGETMDLARRMVHYRTGDPELRTNAWVNRLMNDHLGSQKVIEMDVAYRASVTIGGVTRELVLAVKMDRLLAESAAIACIPATEILNRR
jgi:hypothetical protein